MFEERIYKEVIEAKEIIGVNEIVNQFLENEELLERLNMVLRNQARINYNAAAAFAAVIESGTIIVPKVGFPWFNMPRTDVCLENFRRVKHNWKKRKEISIRWSDLYMEEES